MSHIKLHTTCNITAHYFFIVLLVFAVTGCGFHFRGAYKLPSQMANTFVKSKDDNSELIRVLKRSLKASDVNIVDSAQQSGAMLSIVDEQQKKRVLSVDARGRAREYEISYQVSFSVKSNEDDFLIEQQKIKLQKNFLFDAQDVLGKDREEATLVKDMQQDMVRLIMLRLQATSKK